MRLHRNYHDTAMRDKLAYQDTEISKKKKHWFNSTLVWPLRHRPWKPAIDDDYPFDFDMSLRFERTSNNAWNVPYPYMIGCVSGFMPQYDAHWMRSHIGRMPTGPNTVFDPLNLAWQMTVPGLEKVE